MKISCLNLFGALKKSLFSLVLAGYFLLANSAFTQQDNIFWFAAPDVSSAAGQSPIGLKLLSYANPATVTIDQPANGAFVPIVVNLAANSVSSVDLTPFITSIESPSANAINNNGIRIQSTEIITAYYELSAANNKEILSLKGQKGLGINYYTPFQKFWNNAVIAPATFSSIEIVATQNNTTVVITPRTAITGHAANATFNITLNAGQTYSARDMNVTAASSLAGSIISSDKPVAVTVFSGALSNAGCNSTMADQITPTDFLGKNHILRKGKSTNDKVYILATQNSTSITITNSTTTNTLINWGETYEYDLNDDLNYIVTTKPVYVFHASGNGCNLAGAQVPPVYCAGKYEQNFSRATADSLGLLVYTRAGYEGNFTINGNGSLLISSDFSVVPGTSGEFVVALKYFNTATIPVGSFNQLANSGDIFGMAITNGASSVGSSYAYLSEFASYPTIDAGLDGTICANVPFSLNGLIGGGDVTANWSGTGFGSFASPTNILNNQYIPSTLDTIISPIELILTSTGPCPVIKDTLILTVTPSPIVNANTNQVVCANNANVSLAGTVTGGSTTGVWSSPNGTGTFLPNASTLNATYVPSNADTALGLINLVLTSTGAPSCNPSSDTMTVTITNAPVANIPQDTIYVCSNNPNFNLTGIVSGASNTGKWTTTGNGLFSPNNLALNCQYQPSPLDVSSGLITIYLTTTNNGSCTAVKDSVKIVFTPAPIVNAGPNMFACTNEAEVDLTGLVSGPTSTGAWSGGSGTWNPSNTDLVTSYTPTPAEISAGVLNLTLTSTANGTCNSVSDQMTINFVAPPIANFNYNNACLNDTIYFDDFSLNGFGSIVGWNYDFGDANGAAIPNTYNLYSTPGTYTAELIIESSAGCFDTTTQTITVYDLPVADFTYNSSCNNANVVIDFTDASAVASGTINYWKYDFGGQGSPQFSQNPTNLFTGEGDFVITQIVKTTNGCADTTVKIITIPPSPVAGFFYNTSNGFNVGAQFEFIDTSDYAAAWYWELGNGSTSTNQNPTTVYYENGDYIVTLFSTGPFGCVDSVSKTIKITTVTNEINTLIPNAISPNGDGVNDVWKLEFIQFVNPNAEITILNRWGQTMFQSIGYTDPWDGTYNGELVPEGNYYYIIKLSDDEIYKGALLVLISGIK